MNISIEKGDIFEDKDSRMSYRRLIVVDLATKTRIVNRQGRFVRESVDCAVLINVNDRHLLKPRQVKVRLDVLQKRFRKVPQE